MQNINETEDFNFCKASSCIVNCAISHMLKYNYR